MKKFIARLFLFAFLSLGYVAVSHAWRWWRLMPTVDSAYTLRPDQEVLFIGSSTLGYSIVESAAYSNKVLWVSASPLDTTFMRLAELERRGQLEHVKVLALPFSAQMLTLFTESGAKWSWYQELPVAWRHFDIVPFGRLSLAKYILSNLRPSVPFKICGLAGGEMDKALTDKPDGERLKFLEMIRNEFCGFDLEASNYPGWESRFKENVAQMLATCQRHGIRVIVYRQPLLPFYKEHLPKLAFDEEAKWIDYFKSQGMVYMDIPERYGQDMFHDHMHMTTRGAEAFTRDWFDLFGQLCW